MKIEPRGIRNHNPLNIRKGHTKWQGEREGTDSSFEEFVEDYWGYRAAFRLLKTYFEKYECRTIRSIITRWAPPTENDTDEYINVVCLKTGYDADENIKFKKPTMVKIVMAMSFFENGIEPNKEDIKQGWELL